MSEPASSDDRFDLDVGAYARAVLRRWWLVLLLALIGAVTGAVWWYAQPKTYQATSAVYLGQPTDANGNAIVGVNSNPRAAGQIVQSNDVIQEAAKSVASGDGMTAKQIRHGLTIETPTITVKSTSAPTNYVSITVRGRPADKTAAAANALATILVERLSAYSTAKTEQLKAQLEDQRLRVQSAEARLTEVEQTIDRIAHGSGSSADKLAAEAPYVPLATTLEAQVAAAHAALGETELDLLVAEQVETPRVISSAAPADEPTRQTIWLAVGAGIVAGIVVSLVAVAFLVRRRPAAA